MHNQHALTGWVKCGWCGGPKSLANETRYLCSTHRYAKACKNSRGIKEPVLLAAVYQALFDRIKTGPDFTPQLRLAYASEVEAREAEERQEADLRGRIARLLDAVEQGVDKKLATPRILELQNELEDLKERMQRHDGVAVLPDEATIRAAFAQAIQSVEMSRDVASARLVFQRVLGEVVLTPIADQPKGETMSITLREEGWPELWHLITTDELAGAQ